MSSGVSFSGLLIVTIVVFIIPLVLRLTPASRLSASVLEIVAGIAIGPSGLGWVKVDVPIQILSVIGLGFLLFLAGLEINLHFLKGRLLMRVVLSFLWSFGLALIVGYLLLLTGQVKSPLYIAILLASTALGMVVPLLQDVGEIESEFGQLVIATSSTAQFGAVILLSLFFSNETTKLSIKLVFLASVFFRNLAGTRPARARLQAIGRESPNHYHRSDAGNIAYISCRRLTNRDAARPDNEGKWGRTYCCRAVRRFDFSVQCDDAFASG